MLGRQFWSVPTLCLAMGHTLIVCQHINKHTFRASGLEGLCGVNLELGIVSVESLKRLHSRSRLRCFESAMTLIRFCSTCLLVYAFLSCFYTTSFLFLCPFVKDCSTSFALDISKFYSSLLWTRRLFGDAFAGSSSSHDDAPVATTQMMVLQKAARYRNMDEFLSDLEVLSTGSVLYWASLSRSETIRGAQMLDGVSSTEQNWAP
ncbi:hypothetical protein EDB83DRAFT_1354592 [Lactarius deliciosus]|nr:hypothetical protein EDB83DRAFT_1354592 [Lactarius deliciosus]